MAVQDVAGLTPDELEAIAAGAPRPAPDADATHYDLASDWIARQGEPRPVTAEGRLHRYDPTSGLWRPVPLEELRGQIGARYRTKTCRKFSDYKALSEMVLDLTHNPMFFDAAPVGVMTPGGFFGVTAKGIEQRPSGPELRQRFTIAATPDAAPPHEFEAYLDQALRCEDLDDTLAQMDLMQEIMGAVMLGILFRFERAVLLHGRPASGKSTLLRIIEALVPPEHVAAVSPFDWGSDYHRAALAGKRVNLVGELPADKEVPAAALKTVTGRDRIQARNPFGRVFDFAPTCAHVFSGNDFIVTRDVGPAFWRRWLCFEFGNTVAPEDRDPDLDRRIIETELGAVAGWALEGARRLLERGRFTDSPAHERVLAAWRTSADAVAEFLGDPAAIRPAADAATVRGEVYDAFRGWCRDNERKPLGKRRFFERVESLGYLIAKDAAGDWVIRGLRLAP